VDLFTKKIRKAVDRCEDKRVLTLDFVAAIEVCRHYLGNDWMGRRIDEFNALNDEVEKLLVQDKIMRSGHYLYRLRDCKNFSQIVNDLRKKEFDSFFWELYSAHFFKDSGNEIEFVIQSGVKGSDFDLLAVNKDGRVFNVECKNRVKKENTITTLYNTINKAYRQLPEDQWDNVLHIQVDKKIFTDELDKDIYAFLQGMPELWMIILTYWNWQYSVKDGTLVGLPQHNAFSINFDAEELPIREPESGGIFRPSFAFIYR
jgi:hypothetical protein